MNDEELKKEIEKALAVEPSAHFATRMRERIANEPRKSRIQLPWLAAAAAVAVMAAMIVLHPKERTNPKTAEIASAPQQPVEISQPEVRELLSAPKIKLQVVAKPQRRAIPEVLIDPREAAALQSFLDDVQQEKIAPAKLKGLFEATEKARTVDEIVPMPIAEIEPIRVPPLNASVPDTEGGSL